MIKIVGHDEPPIESDCSGRVKFSLAGAEVNKNERVHGSYLLIEEIDERGQAINQIANIRLFKASKDSSFTLKSIEISNIEHLIVYSGLIGKAVLGSVEIVYLLKNINTIAIYGNIGHCDFDRVTMEGIKDIFVEGNLTSESCRYLYDKQEEINIHLAEVNTEAFNLKGDWRFKSLLISNSSCKNPLSVSADYVWLHGATFSVLPLIKSKILYIKGVGEQETIWHWGNCEASHQPLRRVLLSLNQASKVLQTYRLIGLLSQEIDLDPVYGFYSIERALVKELHYKEASHPTLVRQTLERRTSPFLTRMYMWFNFITSRHQTSLFLPLLWTALALGIYNIFVIPVILPASEWEKTVDPRDTFEVVNFTVETLLRTGTKDFRAVSFIFLFFISTMFVMTKHSYNRLVNYKW